MVVHAINLERVFPFYNPANEVFNHNQSSRKSFSKGNGKLRLSIGAPKKASTSNSNTTNGDPYSIETGGMSSPNLSIEMIDEEEDSESIPIPTEPPNFEFASYALSKYKNSIDYGNNLTSNEAPQDKYQLSKIIGDNETTTIVHGFPLAGESENFSFKQSNIDIGYSSDLDYYSNRNILNNVSDNEEFPVNSAQQPDYAPKLRLNTATTTTTTSSSSSTTAVKKTKTSLENRRSSPPNMTNNLRSTGLRKNSTSVSTMDLHKVDEQFMNLTTTISNKKPMSRGTSPVRDTSRIKKSESSYQIGNRDYHHHHHHNQSKNNKNITVQFFNKPQRSKTAIDIKSAARTLPSSIPRSIQAPQSQQIHQQQQHTIHQQNTIHQLQQTIHQQQQTIHQQQHTTSIVQQETSYVPAESLKESQEYQYLTSHHDAVFNALCNRLTSLELIRNQTR